MSIKIFFFFLKTYWGYLMVITTIVSSVIAWNATVGKKAIEKYVVQQDNTKLKKDVDSLLKVLPYYSLQMNQLTQGQTLILTEVGSVTLAVGALQKSYVLFLKDSKDINKELYSKLTEGLETIRDEVKKNGSPIP